MSIESNTTGLQEILEQARNLPNAGGGEGAVRYTPQALTVAQRAQARANIGASGFEPDCHAEFFQITEDGVVSLKPEYRGQSTRTNYPDCISDMGSGVAGSKNAELPSYLYIPEIVDGIFVNQLANAIFSMNQAVEYVVLPNTITRLPEMCFDQCWHLKAVLNGDRITSIGEKCLQASSVERAFFPNLMSLEANNSFYCCGRLVYAHIGNVEDVPKLAFERCSNLHTVKHNGKIKTVGDRAFRETSKLRVIDPIENVTSIGSYAFIGSRYEHNWDSLTGCSFGTNATSKQLNPTDFWSACTYTACENPLPTKFSQYDPRWINRVFTTWQGTGRTVTYKDGCTWMSIMHIYCGIKNLALSSAPDFESVVDNINPTLRNTFASNQDTATAFMQSLGLNATLFSQWNQESLQAAYDALASGGYVCVEVGSGANITGHAVIIYGVDDNGDFLILDSGSDTYDDRSNYVMCALPYKNKIAPNTKLVVVTP